MNALQLLKYLVTIIEIRKNTIEFKIKNPKVVMDLEDDCVNTELINHYNQELEFINHLLLTTDELLKQFVD